MTAIDDWDRSSAIKRFDLARKNGDSIREASRKAGYSATSIKNWKKEAEKATEENKEAIRNGMAEKEAKDTITKLQLCNDHLRQENRNLRTLVWAIAAGEYEIKHTDVEEIVISSLLKKYEDYIERPGL